jgi:hypothetical protein
MVAALMLGLGAYQWSDAGKNHEIVASGEATKTISASAK